MPDQELNENSSIIVVGCGAWGLSTALHLARRGFKKVLVLGTHPVPSPLAASNDINKVIDFKGTPQPDFTPTVNACLVLAQESWRCWKTDPIFSPYFRESGLVIAGHRPDLIENIQKHEVQDFEADYVKLSTPDDFRKSMPPGVLTGDFPGWEGWFKKKKAGWFHCQKVMVAVWSEASRLGVQFLDGEPRGRVSSLVYEYGDVIGVKTADGRVHLADRTIIAAGAYSNELLDFKKQLRPVAFTICHLQMHQTEIKRYRKLPVMINVGKGFFCEPDADQRQLKVCEEHPGYLNLVSDTSRPGEKKSVPFPRHQIPVEAEARVRAFLRDCMPHLADRELAFARMCWDADTPDRLPLIDVHPDHPSLVLAVGGSGRGAMFFPSIGGYIVDRMLGTLREDVKDSIGWRPETAVDRDWFATQNRFGGNDKMKDLKDFSDDDWTTVAEETSPVGFQAINVDKPDK